MNSTGERPKKNTKQINKKSLNKRNTKTNSECSMNKEGKDMALLNDSINKRGLREIRPRKNLRKNFEILMVKLIRLKSDFISPIAKLAEIVYFIEINLKDLHMGLKWNLKNEINKTHTLRIKGIRVF